MAQTGTRTAAITAAVFFAGLPSLAPAGGEHHIAEVYEHYQVLLERHLTENTRQAFNTERQLRVEGDTLYLTELFDWYEDDYVREEGSVRSFIKAYADESVIDAVEGTSRIRNIDYDWTLNAPGNFPELEARNGD